MQKQQLELLGMMQHPASAESLALQLNVPAAQMAKQVKDLFERRYLVKINSGYPARYEITKATRAKFFPNAEALKQTALEQQTKDRAAERQRKQVVLEQNQATNRALVLDYLRSIPGQYERSWKIAEDLDLEVRATDAILFSLDEAGLVAHVTPEGKQNNGRHWCAIITAGKAMATVPAPAPAPVVTGAPVTAPLPAVAAVPVTVAPVVVKRPIDLDLIRADCKVFFSQAPVGVTLFYDASDLQDMPGIYYRKNVLRTVIADLIHEGFLCPSFDGGICRS